MANTETVDPYNTHDLVAEVAAELKAVAEGATPPPPDATNDEIWASRRMRALAAAETRAAELAALYDAERAQLDRWYEDATGPAAKQIEYLTSVLERWLEARLVADPSGPKTVNLPAGTVKRTKAAATEPANPADLAPLVDWASKRDIPTKTVTTVGWADIKKHIAETGELPPGVELVDKPALYKTSTNTNA